MKRFTAQADAEARGVLPVGTWFPGFDQLKGADRELYTTARRMASLALEREQCIAQLRQLIENSEQRTP